MTIWHENITIDYLNQRGKGSMSDFLGIEFIEIGHDYLKATMPVNERNRQPIGILHGGANVVLGETIASTAANAVINISKQYCVGLEINTNHIRSVKGGIVTGITKPIHLGRSTQIWHFELFNEANKLTATGRMTAAVLTRK